MVLLSLQKSKSITEVLFWISLVVILFAFLNALWDIFFIFLIASSLIFLDYFIIQQYIKKKGEQIEKKTEVKIDFIKRGITTIYGVLFLVFMVIFLFSYNFFWILLMFLTIVGYNIAKRQKKTSSDTGVEDKEKSKEEKKETKPSFFSRLFSKKQSTEEVKEKTEKQQTKADQTISKTQEKRIAAKKPSFFSRLFVKRQLTKEEIKAKEAFDEKLREIKAAEKKARVEKLKEQKRLEELTKNINAEKGLRETESKARMREKKLKHKGEENIRKKLEKERRILEQLESEKKKIIDKEAKLEKLKKGVIEVDSEGGAKESVMDLKEKYETDLDKLVNMVNRYDILKLSEVAEIFKIDVKIAEEWANILEQHNLLSIHYPAIGEAELRKVKEIKK